jgi:hypothetical protein
VSQNPNYFVVFYYILLSNLNGEEAVTILELIKGMKNPSFMANIDQESSMAKTLS